MATTWRKCCNFIQRQIIGALPGGTQQECLFYYAPDINIDLFTVNGFAWDDVAGINTDLNPYGIYYSIHTSGDPSEPRFVLNYVGTEPPTYLPPINDSNGDPITWSWTNCCDKVCLEANLNAGDYALMQSGYFAEPIQNPLTFDDIYFADFIKYIYGQQASYSYTDNGDGTFYIKLDNIYICNLPLSWSSDNITYQDMVACGTPVPSCCDLKVAPFFGGFIEPINSTEFSTSPFSILTTNGVDPCQVTIEFNSQCFDGSSETYLNINGIDNLLPNNFAVQYNFNDGDVIFLKTLKRFDDCSSSFTTMFNVSCQIDYGVVYSINFGDPRCDFCPPWDLIPSIQANTTNYSIAKYPSFPSLIYPGWSYQNTTSQSIDLFLNPTIINSPQIGGEALYLLNNGVQVHLLSDGINVYPITYTLIVGDVIGFKQNSSTCFETETFITNETCDIYIGSQIMNNDNPC